MGLLEEIYGQLTPPTTDVEAPSIVQQAMEAANPVAAGSEAPKGILGQTFDFLMRGQYAGIKFMDELTDGGSDVFFSALGGAAREAWSPKERLSFSDYLRKNFPEWTEEHPYITEGLGFVGDVAFDPTTYLTFGYGAGLKIGKTGQILSRVGKSVLKEEIERAAVKGFKTFEQREVAEKVIADAIADGHKEYLAKFKLFSLPVISQDAASKFADNFYKYSGLKAGIGVAKELPVLNRLVKAGQFVGETLHRGLGLPQEYVSIRKSLEATYAKAVRSVEAAGKRLFGDYDDSVIRQAEIAAQDIYDRTRNLYDKQYQEYSKAFMNAPEMDAVKSAAEAKAAALKDVRSSAQRIIDDTFSQAGISDPKVKALYGVMRQEYQQIGRDLYEKGLVDDLVENYHPLIFDIMSDKAKLKEYVRSLENPFLPAGEIRQIKTFAEARKVAAETGNDIETNAIKLFTIRALEAKKALAFEDFKTQLKGHGYDLTALPRRIQEDIRLLAEGDYPKGMNAAGRIGLQMYDSFTNAFKKVATVLKPAFAVKQAVSNSVQSYLALGPKVFGIFDPTTRLDAFHVLAHQSGYGDQAKFLMSTHRTNLGETITGEDLLRELSDKNIIRGTNIGAGGVERTAKEIKRTIDRERFIRRNFGEEWEGFGKFMTGLANYTSWPSIMEDFARVNLYINARKLGHSKDVAESLVSRGLFDYQHGMSTLERRVIRRMVPFYSFQRFAIPLLADTFLKNPGRLVNVAKTSEEFMKVWSKIDGGEQLNRSERQVLPGWLLDQPYAGMDPERQAMFRVLTNFNPLDIIGLVETDQGGDINIEKTMRKAALAQLAPLVKAPFELFANRNFFTDRAIFGERKSGAIGDVTPEGIFANLLSIVGANVAGVPGAAIGQTVGQVVPEDAARWIMNATGWEDGVDSRTGKPTVYINPFLAYVATSQFPILNQAIRFDRFRDQPFEKWLDLIGGVPTTKINLRDAAGIFRYQKQSEIQKLRAQMKQYYMSGRMDSYDQAKQDLEELLLDLQQTYSNINFGEIRGQ